MQASDIELERQQADEELAQLLGELVVKPLHSQLGESLQNELFTFGNELDRKLRQQLAPLGKSRDLQRSFEDLEKCLEDGQRLLKQQQHDLGSQLTDVKQTNSQRFDALQAYVQALTEQLEQARQHLDQGNQQLHHQLHAPLQRQELALRELLASFEQSDSALRTRVQALVDQLKQSHQSLTEDSRQLQNLLSEQGKQQTHALREQLTQLEQADSQHAAALQTSVQALAGQVTAVQENINANNRQWLSQLGVHLQQQLQALQAQWVSKQEQSAQSLLDRLHQQTTTQQEQLQRAHEELLVKLQKQTSSEQQQVLGLFQQQQALLAQQQQEVQRLRSALSTFAWAGLLLGGLSCTGIAVLALHTPAIRTLLGLAT